MLKTILIFIHLTIPGNVERLLEYSHSNIDLYNTHLMIYENRNLFFAFTTLGILFFYFHYTFISFYFTAFGLFNYIYYFYQWNLFIHHKIF